MTACAEPIDRVRIEAKCRKVRLDCLDEIAELGVGHAGGSMSIIEVLVVLYERHMRVDPENPKMAGRDRFVLSKGHSGPALYAVLADKGFFHESWLKTLNRPGTLLPSHADMRRTPGVDMTTGSLGQGLSCATGIAIAAKLRNDGARVYAVIGDGESDEGQIWEAAMLAGHRGLDNLIAFTDYNRMQIDGETMQILDLDPLPEKWQAFGWRTWSVDGHDVAAIDRAVCEARESAGKPCMIILNTLKGRGVSFLEATRLNNHNVNLSKEQLAIAARELGGRDDA